MLLRSNPGDSVSYGGSYASSRPTAAAGFTGSNCVAPGASSGSGSGSTDDDDDEDETTSIQATATSTVATSSTMAAISTESSASSSTFSDEEYSTTSTYAASSSAAASSTEATTSTSAAVPIPTASMPSSSADPASVSNVDQSGSCAYLNLYLIILFTDHWPSLSNQEAKRQPGSSKPSPWPEARHATKSCQGTPPIEDRTYRPHRSLEGFPLPRLSSCKIRPCRTSDRETGLIWEGH